MAHFAKLGCNGKVIQVLTMDNDKMLNADGVEDESVGQQYLEQHNNWPAQMWIQTSYNTQNNKYKNQDGTEGDPSKAFRGNYAGIGYTWDEDNNIFWPKKPFASWVKNTTTANWDPPITYPSIDTYDSTWTQEEIDAELAAEHSVMPEGTNAGDPKTRSYNIYWDESAYQADNNTGWKATKHDDSTVSWNGSAWA